MSSLRQVILKILEEEQTGLYTSIPASILSYDASTQLATVQPLINYRYSDGVVLEESEIASVPVMFPSAGGGIISFPVQEGDTVLLCFSMRSIDGWVEGGGEATTPTERRLHDLNDAVAIPGLYPRQTALGVSSEDVEIKFNGNRVTLKENGDIAIEGGRIDLGEAAADSIVLGDAFKSYFDSHTHSNGNNGSPTGAPITPMPDTTLSDKVYSE